MPVYLVCVSGMSEAECVSFAYIYLYGRGKQMSNFYYFGTEGWQTTQPLPLKEKQKPVCASCMGRRSAVRL